MIGSCVRQALGVHSLIQRCSQVLRSSSSRRSLLTPAFSCDSAWRARLSAPELSATGGISGLDLGNGLMLALEKSESVASVDLDVYANKLDSFDLDYLTFFASLWAKFRASQDFLAKLESTDHALVRCMISLGRAELLVQWLRDKFTYGIFLDQYSASLLIDHLLEAGDAKLAALASFDYALQDTAQSDGPVCLGVMLLASAARAAEQAIEWSTGRVEAGEDGEEGVEEDDDHPDTKHIIVDYIRLPNYDGHFDLDEERLQVGFTLVCLSRRLMSGWRQQLSQQQQSQQPQGDRQQPFQLPPDAPRIGLSCALIGLAALEKPSEILRLLERHALTAPGAQAAVSRSTLDTADGLLATAQVLKEGQTEADRRGMRPLCRPETLAAARAALKALPVLPDSAVDWHKEATAFARRLVADHEADQGQRLAALYARFEATRLAELRSHGDWLRKRRLFQSVKSQLNALVDEQEALQAFDHAAEIRYAAWRAPRTRAESRLSTKQIWAADVANANRMLDAIRESASRSGVAAPTGLPGSALSAADISLLKQTGVVSIKNKLKPLKE